MPQFLNIPGLVTDMQKITDAGRGKWFSNAMMGLALLKNYNAVRGAAEPDADRHHQEVRQVVRPDRQGLRLVWDPMDAWKRRKDPWNFLFVAGMWFQDLFNYDFRRTEMCIIPYATQEGEISFCAYNTGIGWRKIIENMHKNATVAEWYKKHGRHEIFAGGKEVPLENYDHAMQVDEEDAARVRDRGEGPQNAHEERLAAKKAAREAQMVREYYEKMVLKKKGEEQQLVQIDL